METEQAARILKILLKGFAIRQTVTSLANESGMSRVGAWKVIKKLEAKRLILNSQIGVGKTSAYIVSLNWDNPLTEKTLSFALTEEALKNQRWRAEFAELENKADFLIIYGSILHSPKEANDIDILGVVSTKSRFMEIDLSIQKIQKTQAKKVHSLNFTQAELKQELEKPNKALADAIKKGIVLFGQEKFIKFVKSLYRQ